MNVYIGTYSRLPSTYQEVEYIQSSGSQYIDTGMKFTNNTTSDFDIAFTANRSGWSGIIGAQYQNVNTSRAIGISTSSFTYQQGSAFGDWTETPTLNQKYNYKNDATNVYVDGVVKKSISSGGSFTTPVNGTIFKVNYSSASGFPYLVSAKLYKCKLYESGTLVRDFVPCYRKQDNVIGLYDLVNNQFYTNAGTGTFSKGNDVTMNVLKNDYIGEVYEYSYTFKGKTVSEITSEWTSLIGGVAVNSDGATGIGQDNDLRIGKSIPSLDTAKKIIISGTVVANHSTQNAGELSISMGTGWGTGRAGYQVYGSYFNGLRVEYYDSNNTGTLGNKVGDGVSGNTYKPKTTIDLENKIIIGELSGFSNSTITLTDAQINHIRQFDKLICYAASTWSTISDVSITIEY